jgi:hypothetical protein
MDATNYVFKIFCQQKNQQCGKLLSTYLTPSHGMHWLGSNKKYSGCTQNGHLEIVKLLITNYVFKIILLLKLLILYYTIFC